MKVTAVSVQARDKNRVNVSIDGKYLFSLDMYQLVDFKIKTGNEYSEQEIDEFKNESQFGKVYSRALEYCLSRLHSEKEVKDYLYRKTIDKRLPDGKIKPGVPKAITDRVLEKLIEKKYIDDEKFASFWVENRNQKKGTSKRKLIYELRSKGVSQAVIESVMAGSSRLDENEIRKIIDKKMSRYNDRNKLISYLARQGFSYDDIKSALEEY